jgi:glycerophosphoryl diester phosphodiesterase
MDQNSPPKLAQPVTLIHHAAHNAHGGPPGSLSALENCLKAGAAVVEIDVLPLADGSLALLHEQDLAAETDGSGEASRMRREQVQDLHYRVDGAVTDEKVGFLESALELLAAYPLTQRLQLDLKPYTPLTPAVLQGLLKMISPVKKRVQVTSVADWAVRALASSAPDLSLGFDPLLYLDLVDDEPRPKEIPPFRAGAYGLLDDHPLSAFRWGALYEYFDARAEALLVQVPRCVDWFIRAEVLQMALEAGFDWIGFLHQAGSKVDGWTIDIRQTGHLELARYLVDHGVDALTTDTPSRLAEQLSVETLV